MLKSHQIKALEDLHKKDGNAIVLGKVGCGKTIIAIEFLKQKNIKDALILCPKSLCNQWQSEIIKFGGNLNWQVMNYEKLLDDQTMKNLLNNLPEAVVADEIVKVKSGTGKIAKRFRKLQTRYKIGLCANIMPNSLAECYSPISWYKPGLLGDSFWQFRQRFAIENPHVPGMILSFKEEKWLMEQLNKFIVRVNWDGKNELPEATREIVYVEMPYYEKELYKKLEEESILEVKNEVKITIPNVVSKLTRLVQYINDPQLFGLDMGSKELALARLLDKIGGKVIVFSEHAEVLKRFHKIYGGALYIGSMTNEQRQNAIQRFMGPANILFSSQAGARGLNLQMAETVIQYGLPYTNDMLDQRFGRINRIGQTKPVKEIIMIVKDSCDERIWKIIQKKKNLEIKFNKNDYKLMLGI